MSKIISPLQEAYVPGRQISDNIQLAQEIVHTMQRQKQEKHTLALKLDMSKAFDRVEWPFLMDIMHKIGFCEYFCKLIMQCIGITKISILLNGAPCNSYIPTRGIRQGDPFSPYLFIILMEAFSRQLLYAEQNGSIEGIKIAPRDPSISHLFFADDCLLFTTADLYNVNNLLQIIDSFGNASGQLLNFNKSSRHKDVGGQGFRDLRILNQARLVRAAWRLCKNSEEPWAKAIQAKYFPATSLLHASIKTDYSWSWRGIQHTISFLKANSCWRVGRGNKIKIWLDIWIIGMDNPPSLRAEITDTEDYIWVMKLIQPNGKAWNLQLLQHIFDQQTMDMITKMRISPSVEDKLMWKLTRHGGFTLKTSYKKIYEHNLVDVQVSTEIQGTSVKWKELWEAHTWPRVKHFFWKCLSDILTTRESLARNCRYINQQCPMCNQFDESSLHILFLCPYARAVWMEISGGSAFLQRSHNSVIEIFQSWLLQDKQNGTEDNLINLAMVVAWSIWNDKCETVFQNKKQDPRVTTRKAVFFANYIGSLYRNTSQNQQISHRRLQSNESTWRGSASNCYAGIKDAEQAE
ncbi:uncharacterized protein LOC113291087 [Papaver somniferum]|uniref:uncharacterized protein LOC113291087 n=1 Tax=Papaver somniferum TaxID=3469 RepID=UPI000E701590|nr:uncharacterized protein LOC113291087 [Papaver somniferum]